MFSNIEEALKNYKDILSEYRLFRVIDSGLNENITFNPENFPIFEEEEDFFDFPENQFFDDNENIQYSYNQGDFNELTPNQLLQNNNFNNESSEENTFSEELFFFDEEEIVEKLAKIELDTVENIKLIIFQICKIYLEGNCLNSIEIEEKIKVIESSLEELPNYVESGSEDEFQLQLINLVWTYVNSLKIAFRNLKNFSINIIKSFSLDKNEHFFYIDNKSDSSNNFNDIYTNEIGYLLTLQDIILKITVQDFFLNDNNSSINYLITLENKLNNYKKYTSNIYSSATIKINFLKHKWFKRKEEVSLHNFDVSILDLEKIYRIDDKIYTLKEYNNILLKDWIDKINYHYDIDTKSKEKATKNINQYLYDKYEDLNFFQIHSLIKYYKDINQNLEKLKEIMDYFLTFESKQHYKYNSYSIYDQYCFQIIKNYSINNYFSSYSEKFENIDTYINEYNNCKNSLNNIVDNYFLDFKFLDNALNHINLKVNNNSKSENEYIEIERFTKIINEEIVTILDKYYEKKEWAKSNSNFVFIMPRSDSTINLKNDPDEVIQKIFFATSFVLPFNIKDSDKNYSKVRQKYREVKSLCNVLSNLKKDLNKLENLNKEFDRKDLKSIEIISLFTAIITFVLSSIPAFKFVSSITHAILFMMSLAGSLGIFILLIFWHTRRITNDKSKYSTTIPIFFIISILSICGLALIFMNKRTEIDQIIIKDIQNKKEKVELDSIKKAMFEKK